MEGKSVAFFLYAKRSLSYIQVEIKFHDSLYGYLVMAFIRIV